jgi:hypothetical protein
VWVGLKPTERLQASRGRRQGRRTRRTKTLFEVNGEVRLKKKLTEPTLLEMSGYATYQDLAFSAGVEFTVSHPDAISPGFALVINALCRGQERPTMRHKVGQIGIPIESYESYSGCDRPPR